MTTQTDKKVTISVEEMISFFKLRKKINRASIYDLEFTRNGKVIDIPRDEKDSFEFTGLSNTDFVNFYLLLETELKDIWPEDDGPSLRILSFTKKLEEIKETL